MITLILACQKQPKQSTTKDFTIDNRCDDAESSLCQSATSETTVILDPQSDNRWVAKDPNLAGMEISTPKSFTKKAVAVRVAMTVSAGGEIYQISLNADEVLLVPIEVTLPTSIKDLINAPPKREFDFAIEQSDGSVVPIAAADLLVDGDQITGFLTRAWGTIVIGARDAVKDIYSVSKPITSPQPSVSPQVGSEDDAGNVGNNGNMSPSSQPQTIMMGLPAVINTTTALNITLKGTDVASYKYAILNGNVSCALVQSNDWSNWYPVSRKIQDIINEDNNKTLCVMGRGADEIEDAVKAHHWLQDVLSPVVSGVPLSFTMDNTDYAKANLSWTSAPWDGGSGISAQEVLLYDNDDVYCLSTPKQIIAVPKTATSYQWNRTASSLQGYVTFRLRATDGVGHTTLSACSGSIKLRNNLITFAGTKDDQNIGGTIYLEDVTGDGIKDMIVINSAYRYNRGMVAIIPGGVLVAAESLRVYEGEYSGDNLGSSSPSIKFVDITGDGIKDILMGVPSASPGGRGSAGSLFIIPGGTTLPASGLISQAGYRYDGDQGGDRFGYIYQIEDLNGDSFPDIFNYSTVCEDDKGCINILFGGPILPSSGMIGTAGRRYVGDMAYAHLGFFGDIYVVDVTGDGIKDVVAGQGYGLVVLSGIGAWPVSGDVTAGFRYYYHNPGGLQSSGASPTVGDIDGDGINDILAANTSYPGPFNYNGRVWFIKGGGSLPASGDITTIATRYWTGDNTSSHIGWTPRLADVNGDGCLDIISGYYAYNSNKGILYVMLGQAMMPASNSWSGAGGRSYPGTYTDEKAGYIYLVTDYDNDGKQDIINVSSTADPNGFTDAGVLSFLKGQSPYPASADLKVAGRTYYGEAANAMVGSGGIGFSKDLTGDGVPDYVYYASQFDSGAGANSGRVGIISGGSLPASGSIVTAVTRMYTGDQAGDLLGSSCQVVDFNGDTYADLVCGNQAVNVSGHINAGSLYVIPGGPLLPASGTISARGYRYDGSQDNDRVGSTGMLLDLVGSAALDYVVSSTQASPGGRVGAGSIYVFEGGNGFPPSGLIETVARRIDGDYAGDAIGSCGICGYMYQQSDDFNGDGRIDFITTNKDASPTGKVGAGMVAIIPGGFTATPGTSLLSAIGKRFDGATAGQQLGASGQLLDINADGKKDILLAPSGTSTDAKVALYLGAANVSSMSERILASSALGDGPYVGVGLAVGDVTGDSLPDLVLSSSDFDFGGFLNNGAVHLMPYNFLGVQ